jgi:ABC-type amino acid transport substrate-binding protein
MNITAMTGSRTLEEASSGRKDGETLRVLTLGDKFPSLLRVPTLISDLTTQAFMIKKAGVDIDSATDLKEYRLVINRGVRHTLTIIRGLKNIHVLPSSSLLFAFLSLGRADLGLTGRLNGLSLIKASGIKNVGLIGQSRRVLPLYHYIHEEHKELVLTIDAIVTAIVDSVEMTKLRAKYE